MALWKVKVTVRVDEVLEFEREIEADSKKLAESAAEDAVSDEEIYEALKEKDACALASWDCEAETEEKQCEICDEYFPAEELKDGLCEDCAPVEEDDEEGNDEDDEEEVAE